MFYHSFDLEANFARKSSRAMNEWMLFWPEHHMRLWVNVCVASIRERFPAPFKTFANFQLND